MTQKLTQIAETEVISQEDDQPQVLRFEDFKKKAGERIRTADVQLGNSMLRLQTLVRAALMWCFSVENEDYKPLTG